MRDEWRVHDSSVVAVEEEKWRRAVRVALKEELHRSRSVV